MKKIIFYFLIGLLIAGGVFALPINRRISPISIPVEEKIREIKKIDEKINEKINEIAQEITKIAQEAEIKDEIVEKIKKDIKEINNKIQEEKEIERKIKEKKVEYEKTERRIVSFEQDIDLFEKAELRAMQREIERMGIKIRRPEEIQQGMRGFKQDTRKVLDEAKKTREKTQKEMKETIQRRERIREELRKARQRVEEKTRAIKEETVPLIEEIERTVREEKEIQLAKIAEIQIDTDGDGLSDKQEIEIGTDAFNPDVDGDGFLDGIEVDYGFDPLDPARETEVVYQDPRQIAPREFETYMIQNARVVSLPDGRRGLEIIGRGLPNSQLVLFIFSEPIIVTVRVNEQGQWSYILEDPVDGKHEVFVSVVNNRGETRARSLVFPFVLAGENVAVLPHIAKIAAVPLEEIRINYLIITILIIVLGLIIGLVIINFLAKKREEKKIRV